MKEHMIFIEAGFTPKDANLAKDADELKNRATEFLADVASFANGLVSREVVDSGEIVTPYTLEAERATEFYTGIYIDSRVTLSEQNLLSNAAIMITPALLQNVMMINQRAIAIVTSIITFKEKILRDVLSCKMFTMNYPLLIDHILREAKHYLNMLMKLQNRESINSERDLLEEEIFWNNIMAEHSKFIRGLLDPTEEELFNVANMFRNTFDKLTAEAKAAQDRIEMLPSVTQASIVETRNIREFNTKGTEGLLGYGIKSLILPLLGDHVLRESNHFLRLLETSQSV